MRLPWRSATPLADGALCGHSTDGLSHRLRTVVRTGICLLLLAVLAGVASVTLLQRPAAFARVATFDPVPLLMSAPLGAVDDFCTHHWWVFQATKEFGGVASVGGAGQVVNSLVASTLHTPCTHATVVLPLYDFFRRPPHDALVHPLSRASASALQPSPGTAASGMGAAPIQLADAFTVYRLDRAHPIYASMGNRSSSLLILLLGPPLLPELQDVYAVPGPASLYESSASVPSQVRDYIFASQAAELACAAVGCGPDTHASGHVAAVRDLASALRDPALWGGDTTAVVPPWDARVVWQLHGAPTSQVASSITRRIPAVLRPAIVYTLHDAAYEFMYMLPECGMSYVEAVRMLRVARGTTGVQPSGAQQLAATVSALRYADAVTTVSSPLRSALLDISINSVESVLTDELCDAMQGRRVHGINNALSHDLDPSCNPLPVREHATFVIGRVLASKLAAKQALVEAGVLPASVTAHGAHVMLFIGRFEGVKGFQYTPEAAQELCAAGAHLVVMGGFPAGMDASMADDLGSRAFLALPDWQKQVLITYARLRNSHGRASACPVTLIDTATAQQQYGTLARAAADFALVPSLSEAFGLVAEEALLFGAMPVTSNVGGLMAIVRNHPGFDHMGQGGTPGDVNAPSDVFWNGVQFRMDESNAVPHMRAAIRHALAVMSALTPAQREAYVSAVAFARVKWTEPGGPGQEYLNAFADAYRRREDTVARVQLQDMHALRSCRHASIAATDWSPNLVVWPTSLRPSGSAMYRIAPLPAQTSVASVDALGASDGARIADAPVLRARDVILITTDAEHREGGACADIRSYRELWLSYDAVMQQMAAQASQVALQRFAQLHAVAASSSVSSGADAQDTSTVPAIVRTAMLQHFVHAMMTRSSGPDMLIVISAWSAPLTPLTLLPGATDADFAYRMVVDVDYTDGTEAHGLHASFPRSPVGLWTERRIVLPLKLPFRSVRVYMEVWGVAGTVAFDEPEVRLHIQRV